MFSEKLDFFMNMTNTSNSVLAFAVSVDASHISRLRSGSRKLPKNQNFVMPMAEYFARHIKEPFQKTTIADVLHVEGGWPETEEIAAEIIFKWLLNDNVESSTGVSIFLNGISNAGKTSQIPVANRKDTVVLNPAADNNYYYGDEGKRAAVIRFLSEVIKEDASQTLLLFSDEDMSWMNEDKSFTKVWAGLMVKLVQKGNRIKIIHTLNRSSDEMMEALTKWIPLYMTGAVQSYYYPKLRDGLFKRTMFVAPKTAAIISNSVKNDTDEMLNIYVDNPSAVASIEKEFLRYMGMCRTLMSVMNVLSKDRFIKEYTDFQSINAPTIMFTSIPSYMTMSEKTAKRISNQYPGIFKLLERSRDSFSEITSENEFIEILAPLSCEQDSISLPMGDMLSAKGLFYTKEDYAECLENALELSEKNPKYSVLYTESVIKDIIIYVKEDIGVLVMKSSAPTTVFAFNEPNMTAAVWSYLSDMADNLEKKKEKNIETIKKIIESVK